MYYTGNGMRCAACKKHFTQIERERTTCPLGEEELDVVYAVDPAPTPKRLTAKPNPDDYDMSDIFEQSNYKRTLMEWEDQQRQEAKAKAKAKAAVASEIED